jgi:hypothetical protein
VAYVNSTIGVRWAIMKNEFWPVSIHFQNLKVDLLVLPFFNELGLILRQVGPHRKIGSGQIESVFVVHYR